MASGGAIERAFHTWYGSLKPMKQYGGRPAKGVIAAALVLLERLRSNPTLELKAHLTEGKAQMAGLTVSSLKSILSRFGEHRRFPKEAGRTNRGNPGHMEHLLKALTRAGFAERPKQERNRLIDEMQGFLVQTLDAYFRVEQLQLDFDPRTPPRNIIADILAKAGERNQAGPVAQHLVGAKLALRFAEDDIGNYSYSAADDQAGRTGDYRIGDTAFHVTVAPNPGHVDRCQRNLTEGLTPLLLVSDDRLEFARGLLDMAGIANRASAESIQSFVGQNLSELAAFAPRRFAETLRMLLDEYNRRVEAVETDPSLQIQPPAGLGPSD